MKKNKRNEVFELVLFSFFVGIILLLSLIPNIGYIQVGPIAITIVHIPVLIGVMVLPLLYSLGLGLAFGLGSLIASFIYPSSVLNMAFQNPLISVFPRVLFALFAFFLFYGFSQLQKIKGGKYLIFGLVSTITIIFMYFGAIAFANTLDPNQTTNLKNILIPIFLTIAGALTGFYYWLIGSERMKDNVAIPSSIMISTLFHTVIVFLAISIFRTSALEGTPIMDLIGLFVGTNGFIELIVGTLIATPIAITLRTAFPELAERKFVLFKRKKVEEIENDFNI